MMFLVDENVNGKSIYDAADCILIFILSVVECLFIRKCKLKRRRNTWVFV